MSIGLENFSIDLVNALQSLESDFENDFTGSLVRLLGTLLKDNCEIDLIDLLSGLKIMIIFQSGIPKLYNYTSEMGPQR